MHVMKKNTRERTERMSLQVNGSRREGLMLVS